MGVLAKNCRENLRHTCNIHALRHAYNCATSHSFEKANRKKPANNFLSSTTHLITLPFQILDNNSSFSTISFRSKQLS